MKDNRPINECLGSALDLLAAWIRSSAFPAPQINRVIAVAENGDQTIRLEIPQLKLTQDEKEIFSGKIEHSALGGRAVLVRGNLSAIAAHLDVSSSETSGTVFEICVPARDPLREYAIANAICRKFVNFDFTLKEFFWMWKWTRETTKRLKKRKVDDKIIARKS